MTSFTKFLAPFLKKKLILWLPSCRFKGYDPATYAGTLSACQILKKTKRGSEIHSCSFIFQNYIHSHLYTFPSSKYKTSTFLNSPKHNNNQIIL